MERATFLLTLTLGSRWRGKVAFFMSIKRRLLKPSRQELIVILLLVVIGLVIFTSLTSLEQRKNLIATVKDHVLPFSWGTEVMDSESRQRQLKLEAEIRKSEEAQRQERQSKYEACKKVASSTTESLNCLGILTGLSEEDIKKREECERNLIEKGETPTSRSCLIVKTYTPGGYSTPPRDCGEADIARHFKVFGFNFYTQETTTYINC